MKNIPFNIDFKSLNNVDLFGENHGLYHGKTLDNYYDLYPLSGDTITRKYNPYDFVARNYMDSINNLNDITTFDTNVFYHYIDKTGNYANTEMTF